jgi:hypothetical protein
MNQSDSISGTGNRGQAAMELWYIPGPGRRVWPLRECGLMLLISFLFQMMLLPCLCAAGDVKVNIALAVDAAFVGRVLLARVLRQTNGDWVIYGVILATSCVWIEWVVESDYVRMVLVAVGLMR